MRILWRGCILFLIITGCSYMQPAPRFRSTELPQRERELPNNNTVTIDSTEVLPPNDEVDTQTKTIDDLPDFHNPPDNTVEKNSRDIIFPEEEIIPPATPRYMMTQDDVRAMALMIREFLGAPYVWAGCTPQGTDCSGLVYAVFRDVLGINLPRSAAQMYSMGIPVASGPLQFADLVFFRESPEGRINHVGIYIAQKKFVHASPTKGVMISGLDERYHREHFVGARRIVGRSQR